MGPAEAPEVVPEWLRLVDTASASQVVDLGASRWGLRGPTVDEVVVVYVDQRCQPATREWWALWHQLMSNVANRVH